MSTIPPRRLILCKIAHLKDLIKGDRSVKRDFLGLNKVLLPWYSGVMSGQQCISVEKCSIQLKNKQVVQEFSWTLQEGQVWLVTGSSGGGKEAFIQALANERENSQKPLFIPQSIDSSSEGKAGGHYFNKFVASTQMVSLETAATLIQEERNNDDGDYIEGGIDIGRTAASLIAEVLPQPVELASLEQLPQVQLCGVAPVLNRGVKYLSTGEVRRVLLCRSLLSSCQLLLLSEPFAGLDVESRSILLNFFSEKMKSKESPAIILSMERFQEIPSGITHVLEFEQGAVSFMGTIQDYEIFLLSCQKENGGEKELQVQRQYRESAFQELHSQQALFSASSSSDILEKKETPGEILVDMKNVRVAWGDKVVLNKLNWQVRSGEHWLIRGPNGSGKTTLLELITGDNMQVFCNDVSIFGHRRGTGETVWELKEKMGIVSYRLHLEYRMVGGIDIEAVLLSGFHDSIGLYQQRSQVEQMAVERWLEIGGFKGRGKEVFNSLSYGEQRAILILRAAVKCPPLLILDEPCHGLDEGQRSLVLHLLETIAATGATTLLHVTHDVTEVLPCETHILELKTRRTPDDDENPCYSILTR